MENITAVNVTNNFKIYAGEPGSGKETKAITETENSFNCGHSIVDIWELLWEMEWTTEDGMKAVPTTLHKALTEGTSIALIDYDRLPIEIQAQFIMGLANGKIKCNGEVITVADGFWAIGTMTRGAITC